MREPEQNAHPRHDAKAVAQDPREAPREDDVAAERAESVEHAQAVEHAPQPIRLGERVLFVGNTGTGKSEGLLALFAAHGGQRILIDVQDHYDLGPAALAEDPPPLEVDEPRAIDWRHRTIRYVPRTGAKKEYEELHAAIFRRGNLFVACDEAEDVLPSREIRVYARKVYKQGRKARITAGAASQRPAGVDRSVINQAEHAFVFPMVDGDDLETMSYRLGMSARDLSDALNQLRPFEYLRHTLGGPVLHMPALPPAAIANTRRHVSNPAFRIRG